MFEELQQWVDDNPVRALHAVRIGKTIIDSGVEVKVENTNGPGYDPSKEILEFIERRNRENAKVRALESELIVVKKDREIERLRAFNDELEAANNGLEAANSKLESRLQSLQNIDAELSAIKNGSALTSMSLKIAELESAKSELISQLDETRKLVKQSTPAERGKLGQESVENMVRLVWPAAQICDMSSVSQMSDIHVLNGEYRVVIECKNKQKIDKGDIEKSLRDIEEVRQKYVDFAGYIFISLASKSIPTKGRIKVEMIGGTPVAWVGISSPDQVIEIAHLLAVMAALITGVNSKTIAGGDDELLREDVKVHVASITKQKQIILSLRNHVSELQALVDEAMLRFTDLLTVANDESLVCGKCQRICKSRTGLMIHVTSCMKK